MQYIPRNYEHGLCFVAFSCSCAPVDITHIVQGYFAGSGTGKATLKPQNYQEAILPQQNNTQQNLVHIFFDFLHGVTCDTINYQYISSSLPGAPFTSMV